MDLEQSPDWVKVLSQQRQRYYWFNTRTRATHWEAEPELQSSAYVSQALQWAHEVLITKTAPSMPPTTPSTSGPTTLWVFGAAFPPVVDWRNRFDAVFLSPASAPIPPDRPAFVEPLAFDVARPPRSPQAHVLYVPFSWHEHVASESTYRAWWRFLVASVRVGGYVVGMTWNPEFLAEVRAGEDRYRRYWPQAERRRQAVLQGVWTDAHHHVSFAVTSQDSATTTPTKSVIHSSSATVALPQSVTTPSTAPTSATVLWRYGPSCRSLGCAVDVTTLRHLAAEYRFRLCEWSSFPEFYYNHANRYREAWVRHMGANTQPSSAVWASLDLYQLWVLQKQ